MVISVRVVSIVLYYYPDVAIRGRIYQYQMSSTASNDSNELQVFFVNCDQANLSLSIISLSMEVLWFVVRSLA